ncbi:MAG: sugar ABC transporter permease YjfF [Clostridia bacterium]|nr:sugar ABC transporter permease YjfF [Clostridia bacterium]
MLIPLLVVAAGLATALLLRKRAAAAQIRRETRAPGKTPLARTGVRTLIAALTWAALFAAGCLLLGDRGFARLQTFLYLFNQNACLLCLACGMTCVMMTGGVDLSGGGVTALTCAILAAGMEQYGLSPTQLVPLSLVIGALFGLLQGWLIGCLKAPAPIVTFAGLYLARGAANIINGNSMIPIRSDTWFKAVAGFRLEIPVEGVLLGSRPGVSYPFLTIPALAAIAVLLLVGLLLKFSRFGRGLRAANGAPDENRVGADPRRGKLIAYTLSGGLAAFGGICYCMYTMSSTPALGQGLEMKALFSAVIGGALLTGGSGSMLGALFGVLAVGTAQSIISFHPDLGRYGDSIGNLAVIALAFPFLLVQGAVFRRKPEEAGGISNEANQSINNKGELIDNEQA